MNRAVAVLCSLLAAVWVGPVAARAEHDLDTWLDRICAGPAEWHESVGASSDAALVTCMVPGHGVAEIFVLKGAGLAGAWERSGTAFEQVLNEPRFQVAPPMGFGARRVVVRHGKRGIVVVGGDLTIGPLLSCDSGMDCADRSMLLQDLSGMTEVTLAGLGTWSTGALASRQASDFMRDGAVDRRALARARDITHDTISTNHEVFLSADTLLSSSRTLSWSSANRPLSGILEFPWQWVVRGRESLNAVRMTGVMSKPASPSEVEEHLYGRERLPTLEVLGHCHFPTEQVSEPDGLEDGGTLTYCLDVQSGDIDRLVVRDRHARVRSIAFRVRATDLELPRLLAPIADPRTHEVHRVPGFSTPPRFPTGTPLWVERAFWYDGDDDAPVCIETLVDGIRHGPAWWLGSALEPLAYAMWDEGRLHGRAVVFGQGEGGVSIWRWFVDGRAVHVGQMTTERSTRTVTR